MKQYVIDDFLEETEDTKEDIIDKKVSLLYDLCILHQVHRNPDEREDAVRKLLNSCQSENAMTQVLHDVIIGHTSLDTLLQRKELI